MHISRRGFIGGTLASGVLGIPAHATSSVKVGMMLPVSGVLARYAAEQFPPFRYIIDKINAEGGIKSMGGARIELVVADNASTTAGTASEGRRLVSQEKVSLIVGPLITTEMLAITPIIDQYKIPTLSMTSGGSRSKYLYSIGFPYDEGYARPPVDFIEYLAKSKGRPIKRVALVYSNYEAGQQIANLMEGHLKAKGFEVVGRVPVDRTAPDQTAAVLRIRSLKPDAVTGLLIARDGLLVHKARFDLNYHDTTFVGPGAGYADPPLWRELGPDVAKAVLTRNMFVMTGFNDDVEIPATKALMEELRADMVKNKQEGPIGHYQIWGAQAARIVQAALELAASSDPEAIRDAFSKVRISTGHPHLYAPRKEIAFNADNLLTDSSVLFTQWTEDGKQQTVWPEEFARVEPRAFR
ncbi:MAG: hypothetical protein ABS35_14460 [Kaistia sp. SCN 65-12]|uniref:ABC transporter substrate-binding protein n=1 Tax=Hyphomicrobium sp. CS1BSMeth3 TaxID=1892844 RepID=UPI00086F7B0F|nr:ABC transporter substrate-binding protein [Hyphomicrobium sp. CS1BSMeth3]ODT22624.1 MAG: hypothetical protein ABS35_14460 [Kaistia sp. SCN 65-12]